MVKKMHIVNGQKMVKLMKVSLDHIRTIQTKSMRRNLPETNQF